MYNLFYRDDVPFTGLEVCNCILFNTLSRKVPTHSIGEYAYPHTRDALRIRSSVMMPPFC